MQSDWGAGFVVTVTITNTGTTTTKAWSITWTFSGNQQVANMWNATPNQSGQHVTATSMNYNAAIQAGQSTTLGFQASYSGTNTAPTLGCTTG